MKIFSKNDQKATLYIGKAYRHRICPYYQQIFYFDVNHTSNISWIYCGCTFHIGNTLLKPIILLQSLTLNAPIATTVVCFSRLLKCLWASVANSVDQDQTAPIGAVCSGSTLFASILNLSVLLGSYLQQTTSADDIFQMHFFLAL